jgi:hypothetical protein
MPAKERVRTDEERLLARSAQQPTGRSKEYAVVLLKPRAGDLAAQNCQLVSENHDLKLLELIIQLANSSSSTDRGANADVRMCLQIAAATTG